MNTTLRNMVIIFTILILTSGCAHPTKRVSDAELLTTWNSRLPIGFKIQMELSLLAEQAYHVITDTPIKQLQTEYGAKKVGDLVTAVRDKYRQWQSYGNYNVPRYYTYRTQLIKTDPNRLYNTRINWTSGQTYTAGTLGTNLSGTIYGLMGERNKQPIQGTITSSRGRIIFAGRWGDERNWGIQPPFRDIMQGDRIADIPALIGRIKR